VQRSDRSSLPFAVKLQLSSLYIVAAQPSVSEGQPPPHNPMPAATTATTVYSQCINLPSNSPRADTSPIIRHATSRTAPPQYNRRPLSRARSAPPLCRRPERSDRSSLPFAVKLQLSSLYIVAAQRSDSDVSRHRSNAFALLLLLAVAL
jgi:hypothetical protein